MNRQIIAIRWFVSPIMIPLMTVVVLVYGSLANAGIGVIYEEKVVPTVYLMAVGINGKKALMLETAERDASVMANVLEKRSSYRIDAGNEIGKSKLKKYVLLGNEATRESILSTLDTIAKESGSNDVFIFHFSGSGNRFKDQGFILGTSEFDSAADFSKEVRENAITGDVLKSEFARIRAKTKVLVFDTGVSDFVCEQGDSFFSQRGSNSLFLGTRTVSYDRVRSNEEGKFKEHGTVTGVLLDAIRGDADANFDGVITAWEIVAFVGNIAYDMKRDKQTERDVQFCTSTQGGNFDVSLTDRRIADTVARLRKEKNSETPEATRADPYKPGKPGENVRKREGSDYAVLFAFDDYDQWTPLSNPQNDAREIAKELENRYKFKEVKIEKNLSAAEFYKVLDGLKRRKFTVDDQLFFFFAGHGAANEYKNGFLPAKDSPRLLDRRTKGDFISLDEMLAEIDLIPSKHILVVLDACFSGTVWRPAVKIVRSSLASTRFPVTIDPVVSSLGFWSFLPARLNFSQQDDSLKRDELINRELADRSRLLLTSGWDEVSDGKPGANSPFATKFLEALRDTSSKSGLVILTDIMAKVKRSKNKTPPELGIFTGGEVTATGGFVFCEGGCGPPRSSVPTTEGIR